MRYVAFLRAINVGKGRVVKMDALRRAFESLGLSRVETFIASGNVVFDSSTTNTAALERRIDAKMLAMLGYEAPSFLRTQAELRRVAGYKFTSSAKNSLPFSEHMVFLSRPLSATEKRRLLELATEFDEFTVRGREIYWLRRRKDGVLFSTVALDKALKRPFTVRGASTVRKMANRFC